MRLVSKTDSAGVSGVNISMLLYLWPFTAATVHSSLIKSSNPPLPNPFSKNMQHHDAATAHPSSALLLTHSELHLQSCFLHPLSAALPLDLTPAPGSLLVCLLFRLPRLNPSLALRHVHTLFLHNGKSALETQPFEGCGVSQDPIVKEGMKFGVKYCGKGFWEL